MQLHAKQTRTRSARLANPVRGLLCALMATLCTIAARTEAADQQPWEHTPYKVIATVACDDSARPQPGLEAQLVQAVRDRVEASLRPLWKFTANAAATPAERRQCFALREIPWAELTPEQLAADKLLWLGVKATPAGYELSCREFDLFLRRWSPVRTRFVQQESYLGEACFALLRETFSPLAMIEPIEGNNEQVQLRFKGSKLPRPSGEEAFVALGDAYLPLLRRTDRSGKLLENGLTPVAWTYLAIDDLSTPTAKIFSGSRLPFGSAKRGMVQQVAIGVRNTPGPTPVRFHSRTDKTQGLAGYEVFLAGPNDENTPLGVTDRDGVAVIPPGAENISMVLLRSDGQVLAKVPVVSGGVMQETPIADNVARLQAQAEAQVVREELIDLVARRAIMMGRVKSLLKNGRVDDAKELMSQLDALPSPSVFSRTIDNASRRIPKSGDASVQRRIDSLFSSTRDMLSKFLSTRAITDLQNEVNAAASAPAAEEPSETPAAEPPTS